MHDKACVFEFRAIYNVDRLPFTFSRGDVDANLDALVAGLRPSETNPAEIRGLLKMRWPRNVINKLIFKDLDVCEADGMIINKLIFSGLIMRKTECPY